jgi:hypothetical protein
MNSEARGQPVRAKLRTWLLIAAASVTIFGFFHHVDHVGRGNHSCWPFEEELTPFTFSLLIYPLLLPGLYLTWRGRLMAGYWLFTAAVLLALVTSVHFVGEEREAPIGDIYAVYDSPVVGFLALADLTVLIASLGVLAAVAIQALRITRGVGRPQLDYLPWASSGKTVERKRTKIWL